MNSTAKAFFAGFTVAGSLIAGFDAALAQDNPDRDEISATIVVGAAAIPEYEGSSDLDIAPLVAGEIRWGQRYVAIEGANARINLLNSKTVEFGPVADLTFGRPDDIASLPVRALSPIDDAYQVGAFAAVRVGSLMTEGDELRLSVQATRDVSDVHDGWLGEAALRYRLPVTNRLAVTSEASVRYADDRFARTYFSVTPTGTVASGLSSFDAEGGIRDVGASLTAAYAIDERWSLLAFGGYRRMVGDFAESPIVRTAGDRNQFSAGVGIGIRF